MKKTILITGATDGIGFVTAKKLVSMGHTVLIHGRSPEKLSAVEKQLNDISEDANVMSYLADFSDLTEVQSMAQKLLDSNTQIDVLINNAGIFKIINPTTISGIDIRFMVNTLAPYILTKKLSPLFGSNARVINLSSAAQAPVNPEALKGNVALQDMQAYAQSKLALTMLTSYMAHENDSLMIVAVNPGSLLASKMVKEGFGVEGSDLSIGADILIRAALSEEFTNASGKYFDNDSKQFASPHSDALNDEKNAQIADVIKVLTKNYL